jgi:AcrR family transcriptional regulator
MVLMPRRPKSQKQRREENTEAALSAVLDLLAETGYASLTLTDVAQRAGISRGALAHYFRTKKDVVITASKYALEQAMDNTGRNVSRDFDNIDDAVTAYFEDMVSFYFQKSYIAQLELVFAAKNDPEIDSVFSPIAIEYRNAYDSAWRNKFIHLAIDGTVARNIIEFTNNIMRGMCLNSITRKDVSYRNDILSEWKKHICSALGSDSRNNLSIDTEEIQGG